MLSRFEHALLCTGLEKDKFGGRRFCFLDDRQQSAAFACIIKNATRSSRPPAQPLFRKPYVKPPLTAQQPLSSLEIIVPFCQDLPITVANEQPAR